MKKNIKFLTAKQVSKYLQIPLRTVQHLSKQGKIISFKIGGKWKYIKEDIEKYLTYGIDFSKEPARRNSDFTRRLPEEAGFIPPFLRESLPLRQERDGFVERRAYPRINTNFMCNYSVILPPLREINSEGIIANISAGGVFILSQNSKNENIKIDDPVSLQFVLITDKGHEFKINTRGKVTRKSRDGMGVKFKNIDEETRNKILEYAG